MKMDKISDCPVSQLAALSLHKTQCTSLSGFLAFIQQLRPLFRDAWVPLTFFPASMPAVYHSLINFVWELKHCSASTLGKCPYKTFEWESKDCLSHAGGLVWHKPCLESVCSTIRAMALIILLFFV